MCCELITSNCIKMIVHVGLEGIEELHGKFVGLLLKINQFLIFLNNAYNVYVVVP